MTSFKNPMINNLGNEVWKCKEAKQPVDEAPELGDPSGGDSHGAVGAVSYLMSGSSILIMRHPESIKLVRSFIDLAYAGTALPWISVLSSNSSMMWKSILPPCLRNRT